MSCLYRLFDQLLGEGEELRAPTSLPPCLPSAEIRSANNCWNREEILCIPLYVLVLPILSPVSRVY